MQNGHVQQGRPVPAKALSCACQIVVGLIAGDGDAALIRAREQRRRTAPLLRGENDIRLNSPKTREDKLDEAGQGSERPEEQDQGAMVLAVNYDTTQKLAKDVEQ